jgi:NAD(P)-binding Rossmann-like domain
MPSGNADTLKGKLKMLAGPEALVRLMERATKECDVSVSNGALRWHSDIKKSPGATVHGSRIQSLAQYGAVFVVNLKPGGNDIAVLTFAAASEADAAAWVAAIERIRETPAPPPPVRPPRPVPATGAGTVAALDPTPIEIKYKIQDATIDPPIHVKYYSLLVIACDPVNLLDVCDFTPDEREIFGKFRKYTFHTTLVKVKVPTTPQVHAVIFAPKPLEALNGEIYAFRNESIKQFGLKLANEMTENLVTIYQLAGPDQPIVDLRSALKACDWWPYGLDFKFIKDFITPYFNHFDTASLAAGLPWKILDSQGKKQTLLVHGSACFESVLHCWEYANLMIACAPEAQPALPTNGASPIAVLGAGPSGLMFAARLRDMGYTNIDILEVKVRFGGKTLTVVEAGPYPAGSQEKTVCELGTCYLSPAYSAFPGHTHYSSFVDYLHKQGVLEGNHQIDFAKQAKSFRGIATAGQLPGYYDVKAVIDYSDYVVLKAAHELGLSDWFWDRIEARTQLAYDLGWYGVIYPEYMPGDRPMPVSPPPKAFLEQTYGEFLEGQNLLSLYGLLQYGYELQGYGPVWDIAAFYGLTWITPAVTWAILSSGLGLDVPVVTAWTKGWEDIWMQLVKKKQLTITKPAQVTSICRDCPPRWN